MYLKRLEMRGFKSFVEAQVIFQPGITAVVGPNGVGKSNILDAVLWVLGEQSTKALRSERMEDIIFNGTEARQPLGMAEVSLILGDVDGTSHGNGNGDGEAAPLPFALGECQEVMVTRRLFRDGVSEYFINKTPCRLKDVRSLLLDTRAGSKGHTAIEQGRIDRVLKASPVERRELIEETAGIIRYKKQKAEALRKLEATSQNLLRVRDIINEVRRQLAALERQARAAEQFQALRQEVRRLELTVLVHDYRAVFHESEEADRVLGELALRESAEAVAVARLANEVETHQLGVAEGETTLTGLREQVAQAEAKLAQAVATLELLAQRASLLDEQRVRVQADIERLKQEQQESTDHLARLSARLQQLTKELALRSGVAAESEAVLAEAVRRHRGSQASLDAARKAVMDQAIAATDSNNRLAGDRARAAELRRRIERVEQERLQAVSKLESASTVLAACIERRRTLEAQLAKAQSTRASFTEEVVRVRGQLDEAEQRLARLQEEKAVAVARQKVLQAVTRDVVGGDPGAAANLKGTVAQVLSVPQAYERAIEAVLGHRLLGRLVEGPSEAVKVLQILKAQGTPGGTFVPKRPRVWGARASARWQGAGVVGPARDLVTPRVGHEDLVAYLLDGVVVVEALEQALGLWQTMTEDRQALLVTLGGEVLTPDGILGGGPAGTVAGAMSRERELRDLTARMKELEQELHATQTNRDAFHAVLTTKAKRVESLEAEIHTLEMALVGERKDEQGGEQDVARWNQTIALFQSEREEAEAELATLAGAEQAAADDLQRLDRERAKTEQSLLMQQDGVTAARAEVEKRQAAAADLRVEVAGLQDRLDQARNEQARLEAAAALREGRLSELETERLKLQAAGAAALDERRQVEASMPALDAAIRDVRQRLVGAQESQTSRVAQIRALEAEWTRLRHAQAELHKQQEAIRLCRVEAQTRLEGFEAMLTGTYALNFAGAAAEVGEPNVEKIETIKDTLAQRRRRLSELGPVNVMAIDEHREMEERLRFLTAQEQDLTQSIASLKSIIARINRTTRQLFLETFQNLQGKFNEMFQTFFGGGRAELILMEDEETNEPGVDIVAQPPGKRLKNIAMLSGGERALTAMALIFASFLIRPTPFCVLDEIDAPLDEENTLRFTRVLRELAARTQFIVITHCKQTMEMADALYGITMEEPGVSSMISVRLNKLLAPTY
ncbi:MAG: chromosome segregation protein SMC [Nitrospirae bacterium]|nr:MAG: chromosome segregation protein SMC [Nitrospirota bacterium]